MMDKNEMTKLPELERAYTNAVAELLVGLVPPVTLRDVQESIGEYLSDRESGSDYARKIGNILLLANERPGELTQKLAERIELHREHMLAQDQSRAYLDWALNGSFMFGRNADAKLGRLFVEGVNARVAALHEDLFPVQEAVLSRSIAITRAANSAPTAG